MSKAGTPPMSRRDFFRRGVVRVAEAALEEARARAERRTAHWIRPPFAGDELDFLFKCTRCGDCIEACPHDVIFPLEARLGPRVVSTPALDLVNKACRLCEDWPCVAACEPGALEVPKPVDPEAEGENSLRDPAAPRPRLAVARIDRRLCLPYAGPECGACAHSCPVPGALVWDGPKPRINAASCVGCALCREACIVSPKAVSISAIAGNDIRIGNRSG